MPRRRQSKAAGDDGDPYAGLSETQVSAIHSAFDRAAAGHTTKTRGKKRKRDEGGESGQATIKDAETTNDDGGGFMADDNDASGFMADESGGGGGFLDESMVDEPIQRQQPFQLTNQPLHKSLALNLVPKALEFLKLPSKDPDILETFEEAASSDEEDSAPTRKGQPKRKCVRRHVFVKVCSVLLEVGRVIEEQQHGESEEQSEDDDRDEEFRVEDDSEPSNDDDEEEQVKEKDFVTPSTSKRQTRTSSKKVTSSPLASPLRSRSLSPSPSNMHDDDDEGKQKGKGKAKAKGKGKGKGKPIEYELLQPKQKTLISDTFSLFFSDDWVDIKTGQPIDPSCRKITFDEIRKIADELGEKMTDDEIREMIEYAAPEKGGQVNVMELGRIMIDVGAV